jgi:FAD/FMN-containing dehydrogenase
MLELVRPGEARYSLSRNQFIGRPVEVLPRAVARCDGAADVVEALATARRHGWPFAVRGGGHSNACHSSTDGLVLDLSPDDSITVDGRRVTVGAGVRVGRLAARLASTERLVPGGSCPSVGLVGSALGGGFGSHGRLHGLTCDRLVAAEVVLADGRVLAVDADHEPDLFWALRGAGGGNFGVVTSATFDTVRAMPRTHVRLAWPLRDAPELVRRWLEWAPFADDDVSVELVLLAPDYLEDEPEALLIGAAAPDALAEFLSGVDAEPRLVEVEHLTAAEAVLLQATPASAIAHDPIGLPLVHDRPGMCTARTGFFDRPLPEDAVAALLARLEDGRVHGELREVAFTPWRGAYGRVPAHATAFAHRDATYLVKHTVLVGPVGAARRGQEAVDWTTRSWAAVHPWDTGGAYANFPDPALADWLTAYYGDNAGRLREVKAAYDPEDFFRFAQSVPPPP